MKKNELIEQIKGVIREIGLRKRVYPNWVGAGKMKPEEAEKQIQLMEDVLDTLRMIEWTGGYNYQSEFWEKHKKEII